MNLSKINAIKKTLSATKLRRKTQNCKVFSCKVDKSHLSSQASEFLRMLFLEAKWFCNDIIASNDIFGSDYKKKNVVVLNRNRQPEQREVKNLSSQIRQSLLDKIKQDIINLSKSKKAGYKVGRLKFKKEVRCIPLKQAGVTFKIVDGKHIRIQGCKSTLKIRGFHQIPDNAEIAKAELVKRCSDYYVKITCFMPKQLRVKTGKTIGLDFGIRDNVTTSNGEKFNITISESKRLKRLQRGKFSRKHNGSRNWIKIRNKVGIEYERTNYKKKDLRNKLVSFLTKKYDIVICQDESIREWHSGWFGKQVQRSCMGGIISDLKHKSETFILVDKWFPSTQLCHNPACDNRQEVGLSERIFVCSKCGAIEERDIHSAINILKEGLEHRVMGSPEHVKSPVEKSTSVSNDKLISEKQEAIAF